MNPTKKKRQYHSPWAGVLLTSAVLAGCASGDPTATPSPSATPAAAEVVTEKLVTSVSSALALNPDGNPVTLDSANAAAAVRLGGARSVGNVATYGGDGGYGGDDGGDGGFVGGDTALDLRLRKTAGTGNDFGLIEGWQCKNDALQAFFTLEVENSADNVATYVGTFKVRDDANPPFSVGDADIEKSISTDGTGTITTHILASESAVTFTGGDVNTLAGSNGYAFTWDASGVACGRLADGTEVAFTFTVDATTKQKSGTASTSDTSLCDSLPATGPTYVAPVDFTADETWDCLAPATSTEVTVTDASGLEDAGGTDCELDDSFFASASTDLTECGATASADDLLCVMNTLMAQISQAEKSVKRTLECKFEGVAQMAEDGDIDFGFEDGESSSGEIHILDMGIGG